MAGQGWSGLAYAGRLSVGGMKPSSDSVRIIPRNRILLLKPRVYYRAFLDLLGTWGQTNSPPSLGAIHDQEAISRQWQEKVLNCRPQRRPGVVHPRPEVFWPVDAMELAGRLLG